MENVIVISSSASATDTLSAFLKESFNCNVTTAESAHHAREIISQCRSFELVLINSPLADEAGIELAEYASEITAASCVVLVKGENYEKISPRADRGDIILVAKPFSKQVLYQIIKAVSTALKRSYTLYQENVRLERKIDEIKLIDKAKFCLMQYRNMTEEEAHSYLEQYAMKNRKKKTVAASEIIDKINEQYL
ncbi:MAG: ANTAR domain-containing protein [Ruminococcus flavefaciens]|nr:ANTAR domain-containing protein [Ruminococcus flavefaciens]MCM1229260.1 ANTAR domain-containing protein [Ruminococcus flavefaciens]